MYVPSIDMISYVIAASLIYMKPPICIKKKEPSIDMIKYIDSFYNINTHKKVITFDYFCFDNNVKEGRKLDFLEIKGDKTDSFKYDTTNIEPQVIVDLYYYLVSYKPKSNRVSKKKRTKKTINIKELEEDNFSGDHKSDSMDSKTKQIIEYMEN